MDFAIQFRSSKQKEEFEALVLIVFALVVVVFALIVIVLTLIIVIDFTLIVSIFSLVIIGDLIVLMIRLISGEAGTVAWINITVLGADTIIRSARNQQQQTRCKQENRQNRGDSSHASMITNVFLHSKRL